MIFNSKLGHNAENFDLCYEQIVAIVIKNKVLIKTNQNLSIRHSEITKYFQASLRCIEIQNDVIIYIVLLFKNGLT